MSFCDLYHILAEHAEPHKLSPEEKLAAQAEGGCVREYTEIGVDRAQHLVGGSLASCHAVCRARH